MNLPSHQKLVGGGIFPSIERGVYFHPDFTVSAVHDAAVLARAADLIRRAAQEALNE